MCRRIATSFLLAIIVLGFASAEQVYAQQEKEQSSSKQDYYSQKIKKNEVNFLEQKLSAQEKKYEQTISDLSALVDHLKEELNQTQQKMLQQQKEFEQSLIDKNKELEAKRNVMEDKYQSELSQEKKELSDQLLDKYSQMEKVLKAKEEEYTQTLAEKDKEIESLKKEALANEKNLRLMTAQKEMDLSQGFEKEKQTLEEKVAALKKSQEQLLVYMVKIKEDLKVKDEMLKSKDEQLSVLNKKIALYAGGESYDEKKLTDVLKQDLQTVKNDNDRLQNEISKQTTEFAAQKENYEWKIAQQQKALDNAQRLYEAEKKKADFDWQQKLKLAKAESQQELDRQKQDQAKVIADYEQKIKEITGLLQQKIEAENSLKDQLRDFRDEQVQALESMIKKKAEMLQASASADAGTAGNKTVNEYFDRAMAAINEKNYLRAKYELEQILAIDKKNQMAINMLGNLDFLLKRKQ